MTAFPGGVRLTSSGPVATVWLDRPEVRNAQTFATWHSLAQIAGELPATTQVVLIRGTGPDFSAGMDLRMMRPGGMGAEGSLADLQQLGNAQLDERIATFQQGFSCWRALDAVVIAVVQGRAIGAGCQLALAADLRLLAEDAVLCLAEAGLGLVPDLGGTARLIELVGPSVGLDLCATARPVPAAEARQLGLANYVAPAELLEAALDDLVGSLVTKKPEVLRSVKRLMAAGRWNAYGDQLAAERAAQVPLLRGIAPPH
jgi:enoyl-CoA hydratase/carnithine racemase